MAAKAGPAKISGWRRRSVAAAAAAEDKTLRRERFNIAVLLENRRSDVGRSALPAHTTAPEGALFPAAKILLKRSGKADAVRRSTGRVEGRGISAVFLESPPLTALDTPSRRTANHRSPISTDLPE